eukprot:2003700-Pyramimonas_sp.AAC.1
MLRHARSLVNPFRLVSVQRCRSVVTARVVFCGSHPNSTDRVESVMLPRGDPTAEGSGGEDPTADVPAGRGSLGGT